MKNILFIIVLLIFSCQNSDFNNQKILLAVDYRIFEGTIAWNLAKAVSNEDDSQIRDLVIKNKKLLSFVDPTYGQSLLALSVLTDKYISTRTLLELGANPNTFNGYNGRTPLMEAADIGYYNDDTDSRYLLLLLKFGANPNLEQKYVDYSGSHGQTALSIACAQGTLSYVKILVKAGASIEGKNGTEAISGAVLSENPELLMYLFNAGVDYSNLLQLQICIRDFILLMT